MKNWSEASIIELPLNETNNGGYPNMDFDQQWFDSNGALHVNFVCVS